MGLGAMCVSDRRAAVVVCVRIVFVSWDEKLCSAGSSRPQRRPV